MKRIIGNAFAVFIMLHGLAHLMATSVYWKLAESPELPYSTSILSGQIDLGETGIRIFGLLWLLVGLLMLMAGISLLRHAGWARRALLSITLISLLLCLLIFEMARIGILINLGILTGLLLDSRQSKQPAHGTARHAEAS